MDTRSILQLMLSKGIGDVAIKKILHFACLHQETSLDDLCRNPEQLMPIIRCKEETIDSVNNNRDVADKLYRQLQEHGIIMLSEYDELYPESLKQSLGSQCPPVLFVKGNVLLLSSKAVGFCGSRKVSNKGISITEQCAKQLAEKGITVVSGYAAGTDLAAHSAAMKNHGTTVFVLAEGILRYTKKVAIKEQLTADNHVFVSQFLPNQAWNVGNAMKRNAVIIGLSSAMILVESGKTGGTFAAGEEALSRGTPLFVIDYAKPEVTAEANPYFISRGGMPIRGREGVPVLDRVFGAIESGQNYTGHPEQLHLQI